MELVLLGPPGSGKGTQAKELSTRFGVPHISTGIIFRYNLSEGTALGMAAREYMDKGLLVPDDVTEAMVRERIQDTDAREGFVLDGFPRNLEQAHHFQTMLKELSRRLTAVIHLEVDRAALMRRLTGRRLCPQCGATYHLEFSPPRTVGICDECGHHLEQRADDSEKTAGTRLQVYDRETAPLVGFYRGLGLLADVDGTLSPAQVTASIVRRLVNAS